MKKLLPVVVWALSQLACSKAPNGLWDANITVNKAEIPFRVEFAGSGDNFQAWFFNGDEKTLSTSGKASGNTILARFDQYNSRLEATIADGKLTGAYFRDGKTYPVTAVPYRKPADTGMPPNIAGDWIVETGNEKGEQAWQMQIAQTGSDVAGSVLRVDGDTGVLNGRYADGHFTLSHFSGARPILFVLTMAQDGHLDILENNTKKLMAFRADSARQQNLPSPEDPMEHTKLRDPKQPLHFSFPDLAGHVVSDMDPRFKGKVVILSIGGSWCPNCHDEAPLLGELYSKYKSQGLEIVELSFEEEDQLKNPTRLHAYIKEYGIDYTVLLAGTPDQLAEKLPQAVNLNTFPATFFIGRDGLVKAIHAGFAGKATGPLHDKLVEEIHGTVAKLLEEKV